MANRYLPKDQYTFTLKEGQTGDIVINVAVAYSLIGKTIIWYFEDSSGNRIKTKSTADATITIAGQQIVIPLLVADTTNLSGSYTWQIWSSETGVNDPLGDGKLIIKSN